MSMSVPPPAHPRPPRDPRPRLPPLCRPIRRSHPRLHVHVLLRRCNRVLEGGWQEGQERMLPHTLHHFTAPFSFARHLATPPFKSMPPWPPEEHVRKVFLGEGGQRERRGQGGVRQEGGGLGATRRTLPEAEENLPIAFVRLCCPASQRYSPLTHK